MRSLSPFSRFRNVLSMKSCLLVFMVACLLISFKYSFLTRINNSTHHLEHHEQVLSSSSSPGDCDALGPPRRPQWGQNRDDMINKVAEFVRVYEQRPLKKNQGGMRFDHSFALWYMLRYGIEPKPSIIIESGAFKGHSTWIISQALPESIILSLSPDHPSSKLKSKVTYYTGKQFIDFGKMEWKLKEDEFKNAVVLLDDHQSAYKRIFEQGMKMGFKKFISDDNYGYLSGDNLSMKWLCEIKRSNKWKGFVPDDFGKIKTDQTWDEHIQQMQNFSKYIKYYYEFPPVASEDITGQTRYFKQYTTDPLIHDDALFKSLLGEYGKEEFSQYTHIAYVELID